MPSVRNHGHDYLLFLISAQQREMSVSTRFAKLQILRMGQSATDSRLSTWSDRVFFRKVCLFGISIIFSEKIKTERVQKLPSSNNLSLISIVTFQSQN